MAVLLDLAVSILAGISILFTLYFAWKAFTAYSRTSSETYGVGQQRARIAAQVNIVWSIVLLIVSLILWGVSGMSFGPAEAELLLPVTDTPSATETGAAEATTAVEPIPITTATATATLAPLVTVEVAETTVPPTVAAPPTLTTAPAAPTVTATAAPATAVVSSGVGVWLRATPGTAGEQLEWLLDGTVVTIMPGLQQADDFEWQQVRTIEGVEGWVATDFIVYNNGG